MLFVGKKSALGRNGRINKSMYTLIGGEPYTR